MKTMILTLALTMGFISTAAMAGDDGYLKVTLTKVTCKATPGKEDRFTVNGVLEGTRGGSRFSWGIRYSDKDSNYNYELGPNKEGSHAMHFCTFVKAKIESKEKVHLIARACGYSCNDVRAVLGAVADPGYGTSASFILK